MDNKTRTDQWCSLHPGSAIMRRSSPLKDSILDLFDDDILKNNLSSPPAADSMEGDTEHAVEEQGNIVKCAHSHFRR